MSLPYNVISNNSGSLNSGSYLSSNDHGLFYSGNSPDLWFGVSEQDVIEFSVFDLSTNPLSWKILNTEKEFKNVSLTFQDDKNSPVVYTYKELQNDFVSYKNEKILVNVIEDLKNVDISDGSFTVIYDPVRYMAGNPSNPLSIKEISPSGKEIKLIPSGKVDNRYLAFAFSRFQIKDVSPLLIIKTKQCPYDEVYGKIKDENQVAVDYLKYLFFLPDDASVLLFLRNLYEDYVKYTVLSETQINDGLEPTQIIRIQGIRSYFHNYLLSKKEDVSNFKVIESVYNGFVRDRVNSKFATYQNQTDKNFILAREFVFDFFTKYFYSPITSDLELSYSNKYESYLKNGLNFGNNRILPIMSHGFLSGDGDVPELLIKLAEPLPTDIGTKSLCWITNIGMCPLVFNVVIDSSTQVQTVKISPADFTIKIDGANVSNNNDLYSIEDLDTSTQLEESNFITLNKKLSNLDIDYTSFENFINFSSAELRVNVFKNKMISLSVLENSLTELDQSYSSSLQTAITLPNYLSERESITDQISSIVEGFDGYETFLYKGENYSYNTSTKKFVNEEYVRTVDLEAQEFDKSNRDSFVNNTPQHILLDSQNDDYIIFLSMMGNFFDNIYNYIKCLPSQKKLEIETSSSFTKEMTGNMLSFFGWKSEDDSDISSLLELYSTGSINSKNEKSRIRSIWNRILTTLPLIYKTKGTEESINLLLSCYGIPSTYLTVKEFGGVDYSDDASYTYTSNENVYMMGLYTSENYTKYSDDGMGTTYSILDTDGIGLEVPWIDNIKTLQFKLSIPPDYQKEVPWIVSDVGGVRSGEFYMIKPFQAGTRTPVISQVYYIPSRNISISASVASYGTSSSTRTIWEVGVVREKEKNLGRVYFWMKSGSYHTLTGSYNLNSPSIPVPSAPPVYSDMCVGGYTETSPFPLFDGNIYSIMVRRNYPIDQFESGSENSLPTKYDVVVSRNIDGRISTYVSSSITLDAKSNEAFTRTGQLKFKSYGGIDYPPSPGSTSQVGINVDRVNLWDVPISDLDFQDYTNNYNSYTFSGSEAYKNLWCRIAPHYPILIGSNDIRNESYYYSGHFTETHVLAGTGSLIEPSASLMSSSRNYYHNYWEKHFTGSVPYPYIANSSDGYYSLFTPKLKSTSLLLSNNYSGLTDITESYNSDSCAYTTQSIFPYTFKHYNIPITLATSKYGPNKFKNEKVRKVNKILSTRLDPAAPSAYVSNSLSSPDSGQLGLFIDPQKYKNTDISSYFGNRNLIEELADPTSLNKSKYDTLNLMRKQYRDSSLNTTFFNELISLYRLYFDPSLFSIIRRLTPARSDVVAGVLIEPGILERPKYQHQPITSSITEFQNSTSNVVSLCASGTLSNELLWANLNIPSESITSTLQNSLPPNFSDAIDLSYINDVNKIFDVNYGGNVVDPASKLQISQFGSSDSFGRLGVVYEMDLTNDKPYSGSVFFLLKKWTKYKIHNSTNSSSLSRSGTLLANTYSTSSTYLYDIITVSPSFYNSVAYSSSAFSDYPSGDLPFNAGPPATFSHAPNTFVNTPNEKISNIKIKNLNPFDYSIFDRVFDESADVYFEIFSGYPRNHYTHKAQQFSKYTTIIMDGGGSGSLFVKGRQSTLTTVGEDGLNDGSYPIVITNVGNVNIVKSSNVINR